MPLSYAQNLEDHHLLTAFAGQQTGFYIDVGAGHPVADNVSYALYLVGWRGIVVEPQDDLAALYTALRPRDRVFPGVVGRESGRVAFHEIERLHGLSTMVAEQAADSAARFGAQAKVTRKPSLTLADLCDQYQVGAIDVLKIDVEGAEADVLAGADFSRWRPAVILAEAIAPGSGAPSHGAWEPMLLAAGYDFVLDDTLNRFYVARERGDIRARLPTERAAWDVATHMYEIGRAPENATHPDHDTAKALARGLWASLPTLPHDLVAGLLLRGRSGRTPETAEIAETVAWLGTDEGRAVLGRIACGYDGGQIIDE